MADHLDAPGLTSPAMDALVDITDHYVFQKPDHPDRTILILNVNPLAPAHAAEFRSDAVYETLVDVNGDASYTADQALAIAQILLPDILTYDYSSTARYLSADASRMM